MIALKVFPSAASWMNAAADFAGILPQRFFITPAYNIKPGGIVQADYNDTELICVLKFLLQRCITAPKVNGLITVLRHHFVSYFTINGGTVSAGFR